MRRTQRHRTQRVVGLLLIAVLSAIGGWVAGSRVESPAEAAARIQAPSPSPILVPAELRELSTKVITRGTGRFGLPQPVSLATSGLKGGPPVLTGAARAGEELEEGAIIMRVSERPVFLFQGDVPSFRDLGPGMSGEDVSQLESGLARIGYDPGPVDGVYDERTATAVAALYESVGFEAIVADEAQLAELRTIESALVPGSQPSAGVQVPADEIVFVSTVPVRVAEFLVQRGEVIDGQVATVTDAGVAIDTSVPIESAGLIAEGMRVLIDEPDLGIEGIGVISRVAESPGTEGVDGFHVYFEVIVEGDSATVVNVSVRLTIPVESTQERVLVVPISALFLDADGSSRVQRKSDASLESVTVKPGLSAEGYVAVTPVDGTLEPGDLVVVGFDQS